MTTFVCPRGGTKAVMKKPKPQPLMSWQEAKERGVCRWCGEPFTPAHECRDPKAMPKNKLKFLHGQKKKEE